MTTTTARPPRGIPWPLWIQVLLTKAKVSQAEIGRRTKSSESSVSRVIHGVYLGPYPTERGIARERSIQEAIADALGRNHGDIFPETKTPASKPAGAP